MKNKILTAISIGMLDSQQILTADNALLISLGLDKKD